MNINIHERKKERKKKRKKERKKERKKNRKKRGSMLHEFIIQINFMPLRETETDLRMSRIKDV